MKDEDFPVFMDVHIYQPPYQRMVFELFYDVAPLTAENFRALCTGEKGTSPKTNKPLCYRCCFFHPVKRGGSYVKGAAFCYKTGEGVESIFGPHFPVESNELKHDEAGLLSMPQQDQKSSGSDFIITLKADHSLDSTHVVFGKLVEGLDTLQAIGKYCAEMKIEIFRSGVLYNARGRPIDVRPCQSNVVSCHGRALVEQNRARYERPSSSKPEVHKACFHKERVTEERPFSSKPKVHKAFVAKPKVLKPFVPKPMIHNAFIPKPKVLKAFIAKPMIGKAFFLKSKIHKAIFHKTKVSKNQG